ncbi:unnamed protein product [Adineta ricciae]|uniref:G-protein coupled receptors family 1 profile domain-containing protein n=1 Tax=Adineta ricciae TaxID=249248 RepID=A0A814AL76_ADIRI|nr:unnamed protein product [Adineta ricciae]CAF0915807.1 unnamed protein product [Adineta ricciae]
MLNSSDVDLLMKLNTISIQFNRYFSIFIFLFGSVGNLLNCLVLSQPSLRSNPCVFYFLISSIANMISICSGLTTRILSGWDMDYTDTNVYMCKIRAFFMFVSRSVAFWLIALAAADRYLSSSHLYHRRQLSSLENAQHGTIFVIIFSLLIYCQILYCYDINIISAPLHCYGKTVICRLTTDLTYGIITIACPLLIMFVCGLLTIRNVRNQYDAASGRKHLIDVNYSATKRTLSYQYRRRKRINRYLCHVLFVQIVFLVVLTTPQAIEKFYTTLTIYQIKSDLHVAINNFIYNFALLLTYLASGMTFYIYTLSGGNTFRNALFDLFK